MTLVVPSSWLAAFGAVGIALLIGVALRFWRQFLEKKRPYWQELIAYTLLFVALDFLFHWWWLLSPLW